MAAVQSMNIREIFELVKHSPHQYLWSTYDSRADALYINFKKPAHATESDLTDDDIIVRYEHEQVIGLTVLRASTRR